MIIDDVKITVIAGKGGKGLASFRNAKMMLGPTGGNGGRGGNVFLEGVSDLGALRQFRFKKVNQAQNGENGKIKLNDGFDGEDLILKIPVGTVATIAQISPSEQSDLSAPAKKVIEISKIGQKELIAKGGSGGKGNYLYRSATNTSPKQFGEGKFGETFEVRLELKLIADVGFIGLPNVGKSSLLNELTNAKSKVANYPFTTLEPNLGVYYDLVLADIPGLIEGASEGKGLGTKFLRHIERTKTLFHFVAADSLSPLEDYKTVRKEMEIHNPLLLEKPEYVFISKSDTADKSTIEEIKEEFKKIDKEAIEISIIDPESLNKVKKILNKLIAEKQVTKSEA